MDIRDHADFHLVPTPHMVVYVRVYHFFSLKK